MLKLDIHAEKPVNTNNSSLPLPSPLSPRPHKKTLNNQVNFIRMSNLKF